MSKNEKPRLRLDRFTSTQINEWVLDKLESNPLLYGSDIGNPAIILKYLQETNPRTLIENITIEAISGGVSASRQKNLILQDREDLDFREVYAIDRTKKLQGSK